MIAQIADGDEVVSGGASTSPALAVIPPPTAPPPVARSTAPVRTVAEPALYEALAAWRRRRASGAGVPAYHVFANRTLAAIAEAKPRSREELLALPGVGPAKLERYGEEVLELVAAA